ncbi:MAG: ABC transporter ATP-binding protein, partial [Clostridia bacterium]|nr:ABC transporter ATP-binding protein [Clostridia bacterium]
MLKLTNIVKEYLSGDNKVSALRGVDLTFRQNEFVSILGPSGCGKTTLLNIIGGLDQYTDGDLFINGRSTKEFRDSDWDSYRNHSIGFVFQSYNLIPHQSVLSNVELALTLSGVSKAERRKRAIEALEKVGLSDQIHKKPNQMSGGQMQRVAIARALVNNPHILLADEPTGALDSETSVQIMELLKEIAREKLVIMVTHNPELAEEYSTRIIRLLDGRITGDTNPYTEEVTEPAEEPKKKRREKSEKKPSMSFFTALSLSLNNLMTKKARTILTSFAGSIGIIGIALILALSNGIQTYIDDVQEDTLASYPITIEAEQVDMSALITTFMGINAESKEHALDKVYSSPVLNELLNTMTNAEVSVNNLKAFKTYLESNPNGIDEFISAIDYTYDFDFNVFIKDSEGSIIKSDAMQLMQESIGMDMDMGFAENSPMGMNQIKIYQQMLPKKGGSGINDLVLSQYDVIHGGWPSNYNEVVVVVNENNEISDVSLLALGLTTLEEAKAIWNDVEEGKEVDSEVKSWSYDDICNLEFTLVPSCDFYSLDPLTGAYIDISQTESGLSYMYDNGIKMKVSGIIRPKEDASSAMLQGTVAYTKALTDYVIEHTAKSEIVKAQKEKPDTDVLLNLPFKPDDYKEPTVPEKAAAFKEYAKKLTPAKKAELYKAIASVPEDAYLEQTVNAQMANMNREYIETMLVDSFANETGMNADTVREYIAKMTDD